MYANPITLISLALGVAAASVIVSVPSPSYPVSQFPTVSSYFDPAAYGNGLNRSFTFTFPTFPTGNHSSSFHTRTHHKPTSCHSHRHHHHHHHDKCTSHKSPCTSHKRPCTSHKSPCTSHKSPCTSHKRPCTTECHTKTYTTKIHNKPCYLLCWPCPTNPKSIITSTVTTLPTAVCAPCTQYVTVTTTPAQVCSTFIFCDIAGQNSNCLAYNNAHIQSIASLAHRQGGNVFINGQLTNMNGKKHVVHSEKNKGVVETVTGQATENAAMNLDFGNSILALFGGVAFFLFAAV